MAVTGERQGFSWSRGQLWVDGMLVSEQYFPARLSEVETRKQMEAAAAQARGAAEGVRDQMPKAGKALTDLLKR